MMSITGSESHRAGFAQVVLQHGELHMHDLPVESPQIKRLDALDPGLPYLATQAAIELDNLLLKREVELSAVKCLAERLENSVETGSDSGIKKALMDPNTVAVFSSAILASGIPEVRTLSELANEAQQIATELHSSHDQSDEGRIESLRTFCRLLAQSAVAHERSVYEKQSFNQNWS
jgi:hypothetical protein